MLLDLVELPLLAAVHAGLGWRSPKASQHIQFLCARGCLNVLEEYLGVRRNLQVLLFRFPLTYEYMSRLHRPVKGK